MVFPHFDSKQFQVCFIKWIQIFKGIMGKLIAVDGKTLRGSKDGDQSALHLVSAFATESSLVLGQIKSKQITKEGSLRVFSSCLRY